MIVRLLSAIPANPGRHARQHWRRKNTTRIIDDEDLTDDRNSPDGSHDGTGIPGLRLLRGDDYLLPQSRAEIALFAGVSVTAGICEEVLFRGFLFAYLQASPWSLDPSTVILVSSAMFGIAHFGQGIKGMLLTGMIGAALGILYVVTGSLLAPIIVHILIDLRAAALCYLRASTSNQPA